MSSNERTLLIVFVILIAAMILGILLYSAGTYIAKSECQALGFEWGVLVLYPVFQIECEYQLRVPLREIAPPIEQGDKEYNGFYKYNTRENAHISSLKQIRIEWL